MAYCVRCGAQVNEGVRICPQCGAEVPVNGNAGFNPYQDYQQAGGQSGQQNNSYNYNQGNNYQGGYTYQYSDAGHFDQNDVRQNKVMAVLAYLGILVLIPLFARDKQSEYARFHTNQGLVLWIAGIIVNLLTGGSFFGIHLWFYFDSWFMSILGGILSLVIFIFAIVGIVYACRGERRELPIVGSIKIIK